MDQRQITYFLAVCEAGNITAAAERLFMTRQALSGSMHLLEQELGVELFVRSKQGVALTWEGRVFRPYAEESDRRYREMLQDIAPQKKRYTLKIGAPLLYMEDEWVSRILAFSRQEPQVTLSVENDEDYTGFFDKVAKGKLDIAWTRMAPEGKRLQCIKVRDLKLMAMVAKDSPLARRRVLDYTKDLVGETHLVVSQDTMRDLAEPAARAGIECRLISAQSALLKSMVAEGEGFIVVPAGYDQKLVTDQVATVELANFPVERGIYLVHKANPSAYVGRFIEFFMEHVASPE